MNKDYLSGVANGKKFVEYANIYGLLDAKTHFWAMAFCDNKEFFYRGFFNALK